MDLHYAYKPLKYRISHDSPFGIWISPFQTPTIGIRACSIPENMPEASFVARVQAIEGKRSNNWRISDFCFLLPANFYHASDIINLRDSPSPGQEFRWQTLRTCTPQRSSDWLARNSKDYGKFTSFQSSRNSSLLRLKQKGDWPLGLSIPFASSVPRGFCKDSWKSLKMTHSQSVPAWPLLNPLYSDWRAWKGSLTPQCP